MGGVQVGLLSISSSVLNAEECSTSRSGCFIPGKEARQRLKGWRGAEGGRGGAEGGPRGAEGGRGPVSKSVEMRKSPNGIRTPVFPARSTVAIPTELPWPHHNNAQQLNSCFLSLIVDLIFMDDFMVMSTAHAIQHRMEGWLWNGELKRDCSVMQVGLLSWCSVERPISNYSDTSANEWPS